MDRLNLTPRERAVEAILIRDQDQPFYVVARRIDQLYRVTERIAASHNARVQTPEEARDEAEAIEQGHDR